MNRRLKSIILGDAMIPYKGFKAAWDAHLSDFGDCIFSGDWEKNWDSLQFRRLEVEKNGPEIEPCDPLILEYGSEADILMGLFVPISKAVMEAMPNLRIAGVSRAGIENVNIEEATKRGILVFNVKGRNAHAVSDFTVGMMLAETRNIARAFHSIKNNGWRKSFSNSNCVPEMHGKTIGIIGFGYIGQLVAKKLSSFDVDIIVFDPYMEEVDINRLGAKKVSLEELFRKSDIVSVHARLTDANRGMIKKSHIDSMKPTSYFINTGRSGLVDQSALAAALKEKRIQGAALDVFDTEPIAKDSPFLELDNVTLTTHIAGTTSEALSNSPFLLAEDIASFLKEKNAKFIVNKDVLENDAFQKWLNEVRGN